MKVYFDTEFPSLWVPEPMSVGMAAEDGSTLYRELPYDAAKLSRFSRDVVVPLMEGTTSDRFQASDDIRAFLFRFGKPELVCDFIGDWWLLLGLVPDIADLATPRCTLQGAPDSAYANPKLRHNALADAIALRDFAPAIQPDTD